MRIRRDSNRFLFAATAIFALSLVYSGADAAALQGQSATPRRMAEVAVAPTPSAKKSTDLPVSRRVIPLERGSNFRDIGGYEGSDGKHVRWGMIYRSAALTLLSDADIARLKGLGIEQVIDLRATEERTLAPDKLDGVPYTAVGYPFKTLLPTYEGSLTQGEVIHRANRAFPTLLAPHLRLVFSALLGNSGPLVYHCTAGQDRTGFVSAMILVALGVPRSTILDDYHLSTKYRRPEFESPRLNAADYPRGSAMHLIAQAQQHPEWWAAQPMQDAQGPYIRSAFEEIERVWGSVDNYLEKEIGLTVGDIRKLRRMYLE